MNRRRFLGLVGAVGGVTAGCVGRGVLTGGGNSDPGWPMSRSGPAGTGYNPAATGPVAEPAVRWRFDAGHAGGTGVAVANETVFAGSGATLYALAGPSGTVDWTFDVEGEVTGTPAVVNGRVYFGETYFVDGRMRGRVLTVDASDGTEAWRTVLDGNTVHAPIVADDRVYVNDGGGVSALSAGDGSRQWSATFANRLASPPTVGDEVYAVTRRGTVHALDPDTGGTAWTTALGGDGIRSPAVRNGTVYVTAERGVLYALDAETGAEAWRFEDLGRPTAPAVAGDTTYVGDDEGGFYAFDAGERIWRTTIDGRLASPPATSSDSVFVGGLGGRVHAFSRETGDHRWSFETELRTRGDVIAQGVTESPVPVGDAVYVSSDGTDIYALE